MFGLTICANGWRCLRSAVPGSLLRVGLTEGSPLSWCCKVMRWNDSWRAHCGTCSLFNDANASCSNQPTRQKEHVLPECTAPVTPRPPGGFLLKRVLFNWKPRFGDPLWPPVELHHLSYTVTEMWSVFIQCLITIKALMTPNIYKTKTGQCLCVVKPSRITVTSSKHSRSCTSL